MNAPLRVSSVRVPLAFISVGLLSLLLGMFCLVAYPEILARYHYNQRVIAVTHLFTLGWISSVIMGAMYQLVPVALETRLYSERLPHWHFALHCLGFVGMVAMFWKWNILLAGAFALALIAGITLFVGNLGQTLRRIPRWNVVAAGIASALAWLCVTVTAGLLLAASKLWSISPFDPIRQMHAHAHAGALGFFILLIVAVSYRLVPMFVLGEVQNQRRAWISIFLLNVATAGLVLTILFGSPWKLAFTLLVMAAIGFYAAELLAILRTRKRRPLDWGIKYFLTAIALLIPLCLVALPLSWPNLPLNDFTGQSENVYGLLSLLGVVTLAILGMLYKVVPFLVWYSRYSREIGRQKVPALADLYSHRLQKIGYWIFLGGVLLATISTLLGHAACIQRACALWTVSVVLFAINYLKICRHLLRSKAQPILINPALKGAS